MTKLSTYLGFGTCVLFVLGPLGHQADADDQEMDSEYELKRMLTFVRPLMGILRSDPLVKRSTDVMETGWMSSSRAIAGRPRDDYGYGGGDYGGYGGGGGYSNYGYDTCCGHQKDYLSIISLIALGLLFLFLVQLLSTTKAGRRKKRSDDDDNDLLSLEELLSEQDVVLLDGPTWLSMVHELWEQDAAL
ncbi:hypothetical protein DAPPUDRAFT_225832, partial [Daphnia pulex]